jgi:hypothetical protein
MLVCRMRHYVASERLSRLNIAQVMPLHDVRCAAGGSYSGHRVHAITPLRRYEGVTLMAFSHVPCKFHFGGVQTDMGWLRRCRNVAARLSPNG